MALDDMKTAEEMAAKIKQEQSEALDAVKAVAEDALGKAKAGEALLAGQKQSADEAITKLNELTESVKDMDQKLERAKAFQDAVGAAKRLVCSLSKTKASRRCLKRVQTFVARLACSLRQRLRLQSLMRLDLLAQR